MNIKGSPPACRIAGAKRCEHFTSNTIVPPGTRDNTSCANKAIWRSGKMMLPSLVTIPKRSPSPSNAKPISASLYFKACNRSFKLSSLLGSGWWLGKLPSTSLNNSMTSQPIARNMDGAVAPAMPLPQSTTIFMGRCKRISLTIRAW